MEKNREDMLNGDYTIQIEDGTFSIKKYNEFIESIRDEAEAFKVSQKAAAARWTKGY